MNKEYSVVSTVWGELSIQEKCDDCIKQYGYFPQYNKETLQGLCNLLNSQSNQIETLTETELSYWDILQDNMILEEKLIKVNELIEKYIKQYEQLAVDLRNNDTYGNKSAHTVIETLTELQCDIKDMKHGVSRSNDHHIFNAITNMTQKYEAKYKEYQRQHNTEMMKLTAHYGLCLNELKSLLKKDTK